MEIRTLWLILALAVPVSVLSQELTPEQFYEQYWNFSTYARSGLIRPIWLGNGNRFCNARELNSGRQFFLADPINSTKEHAFDVLRLRAAITKLLPEEDLPIGVPFEHFMFVQVDQAIQFDWKGATYRLILDTYSLEQLPSALPEDKPFDLLILPGQGHGSDLVSLGFSRSARRPLYLFFVYFGLKRLAFCQKWADLRPFYERHHKFTQNIGGAQ